MENLRAVEERIAAACQEAGRARDEVRLIAVSKTHPPETIRRAFALGLRVFGENYAQELWAKAEATRDLPIEWVYIGKLQSNKIARLVEVASEIQTAESEKHLRLIARAAQERGKTPFPVMIAVNVGEEQKGGAPLSLARGLARIARSMPELSLRGIFCIPPASIQDPEPGELLIVPPLFRELKALADEVAGGGLSLGMSGDLRLAIAAGSTTVRIGTAIFGARR